MAAEASQEASEPAVADGAGTRLRQNRRVVSGGGEPWKLLEMAKIALRFEWAGHACDKGKKYISRRLKRKYMKWFRVF